MDLVHKNTSAPYELKPEAAPSSEVLLDVDGVASLLGCSSRHVYRLNREGKIPKPKRIGGSLVRWIRSELLRWIENDCDEGTNND